MTWLRRLSVLVGLLVLAVPAGAAWGAMSPPEGYVPADCSEAPGTPTPFGQPSGPVERQCLRSPDGQSWSIVEVPADEGGSGMTFLGIILIGVLWMAVPVGIAIYMARRHDENPGLAVILTLVLGWIGLLIVVYGQRRTAQALHDMAGAGHTRAPDAPLEDIGTR